MKAVILQPSYIPWRGFFDQIYRADVFVFYDDVQYDKRGWRNRNQIKTPRGKQWLTIPVHSRGAQTEHIPINQIRISWDSPWNEDHWNLLQASYSKSSYFQKYADVIHEFYQRHDELLADFTIDLTIAMARQLGIQNTRFLRSSNLQTAGAKHRSVDLHPKGDWCGSLYQRDPPPGLHRTGKIRSSRHPYRVYEIQLPGISTALSAI